MRDANGAASIGCMSSLASQCPTGFTYSIFGSNDGRKPLLTQCWASNSNVNCGTAPSPAAATVPIYDVFATTNRVSA
jgi:hypothetical protein